jgi:HK97 family phage major capsid protein
MNLEQLLKLRDAALEKADAIRKKVAGESRAMTTEERTEFRSLMDECDRLNGDIETEKRFQDTEKIRLAGEQTRSDQRTNRPDPAMSNPRDLAEDKPFANFGEQLLAIRNAVSTRRETFDPRLRKFDLKDMHVRAAAGLNETVASDGGFLLDVETGREIEKVAFDTGILAAKTRKIPLGGNSVGIKIPTVDETSRANGSRWGGVRAYWQNEASATTATKPKFGMVELGLNKLFALVYATDELLTDVTALGSYISQAAGEEIAFSLDDAIVRGPGAGVPLGVLNAACTVSVAKEGSQAAATVLYQNVSKMRARMTPRSFLKAEWYVNVDCFPQLEQLHVPHKNVAGTENVGGQSVWLPPRGAQDPPNGTLFGRPVNVIEHAESIGTVGDIMLLDLGEYLMTTKGGVQTASSIHVNFLTDETAFRFTYRTDGQPSRKSAITPYRGTGTLSPFVTLATRA